ncbi:hypothetical protein HCUR_00205 [Holospora curviuscula]|uniref:Uncharacterized protein n=1 Tax=Holospora curviuscula TaxID=1082868 RepID=A0A2S5RDZ3_9PROT|nr:hypothetical protein HCUR_00205 [Holospora curviuscula]
MVLGRIVSGYALFFLLQLYLGFFYGGSASVGHINRIGVTFFVVLFIFLLAGVGRYIVSM